MRPILRQVDAAADRRLGGGADVERRVQEPPLDVGVVGDGLRLAEQVLVEPQLDRRLVVRGRHEDAARRVDLQAQRGRRVQVREEDQDVVAAVRALQVLEQPGRHRALAAQPVLLVGVGVRVVEDPVREAVELLDVAGLAGGEAPHRDAADAVDALGVLVLPGDVVAGAGGQHFDLVPRREALGDQAAVVLRAAEDVGAVALDDERDLHAWTPRLAESVGVGCSIRRTPR